MQKCNRNLTLIKWLYVFINTPMCFFYAIFLYQITNSYSISGIIMAINSFTQVILEIPTGIVSDKYLGRKGTQLCCYTFYVLGWSIALMFFLDWKFLLISSFFFGCGNALNSGNLNALLLDTLRDSKRECDFNFFLSKYMKYKHFYTAISTFLGGVIAYYLGLVWVLLYSVIQGSIALLLTFFLKEPEFHKSDEVNNRLGAWKHLIASFRTIKRNKELRNISFLKSLHKSICFSIDDYLSIFYKQFLSFYLIGLLFSLSSFLKAMVLKYSSIFVKKLGNLKSLNIVEFISIPFSFFAYFLPGVWAPIMVELTMSLSVFSNVTHTSLLHEKMSNKKRATIESMVEIFTKLLTVILLLLIGVLADWLGLINALLIFVCLRIIIIPLNYIAVKE